MKKNIARGISLVLATGLLVASFTGCKATPKTSSTTSGTKYATAETWDVFDSYGNYQGIQAGWYAKIVKDKFNVTLNIISPNVAGGGNSLYTTRSAAGNLGDLIMIGTDHLSDTIKAGLLYDMAPLLKDHGSYVSKYTTAITNVQTAFKTGAAVYAIPASVTTQSAMTPSEGQDLTYGPYLRWDYYQGIGSPKMSTLDDLLPVLKSMQAKYPTTADGKKTYAFSLFKDWDGNMMCTAKQFACMYGYDENGFMLLSPDGTKEQSIIDPSSLYVKTLQLYFNANQEGLVDPDSATQNYSTLYTKFQDGQILFSWWPWLGASAFNTVDNKAAGKGYELVPIADEKIVSTGCNPYGSTYTTAIGKNAADPSRIMDFINWMYSPEGLEDEYAGPEGLTWDMENGKPTETSYGLTALPSNKVAVAAAWGGGTFQGGMDPFNNMYYVIGSDTNPVTGDKYDPTQWATTIANSITPLDKSWQAAENATSAKDYLIKNKQIEVTPGNSYVAPTPSSTILTERNQCNAIIKQYSWEMVFAKNQAAFNTLLTQMTTQVNGLGYADCYKVDQANASLAKAARDAGAATATK